MTRIVSELIQVLFALNAVYFASEKEALKAIESFPARPKEYATRINDILSCPGQGATLIQSLKKLDDIIQEAKELCGLLYTSKYSRSKDRKNKPILNFILACNAANLKRISCFCGPNLGFRAQNGAFKAFLEEFNRF
jgi:hypothetical protein